MPEAPEVRVAAAQLAAVANGRTVEAAAVTHPRTIRARPDLDVSGWLVGRQVEQVSAVGKWLQVDLDDGPPLRIHLRMSGVLLAAVPDSPHPDRHVHGVLRLSGRSDGRTPGLGPPPVAGAAGIGRASVEVWFRDPRTFGEWRVGPVEPSGLPPDAADAGTLVAHCARRTAGVKSVLLDQQGPVVGFGSYLADEALWCAGIAPTRPSGSLTHEDWTAVLDAGAALVEASVSLGGVTLADEGWHDLWRRPGAFGDRLVVHARDRCPRCGTPTRRTLLAGRSARWCPRCQPD